VREHNNNSHTSFLYYSFYECLANMY